MKKQVITWTAIPHGLDGALGPGGRLGISVFISPRLEEDGTPTLNDFQDWLLWPETVAKLHYKVHFGGGPTLDAKVVSKRPDMAIWSALFTKDTPVNPFKFEDRTDQLIRSFPVSRIQNDIKKRYQAVAQVLAQSKDPEQLLNLRYLYDLVADLVPRNRPRAMNEVINAPLARLKAIPSTLQPGGVPGDYHQVDLFTHREVIHSSPYAGIRRPKKADLYDLFDFHKMISALGNYPALLSRLGLVVELEVPMAAAVPSGAGSTTIQIEPSHFAGPPNVRPLTHYLLDANGYRARKKSGSILTDDLLLRLSDKNAFDVTQMDVDGAAIKLINAAANIAQSFSHRTPSTPQQQGVPSLRSAGISLIHTGRAYDLAQRFAIAAGQNASATGGGTVNLYADDLVRGYAVDIWHKLTGNWYSLCRRTGTYTFKHAPTGRQRLTQEDDGFVAMSVAQSPTGSPSDLYLHEQLCRWNGWSLVAPRPITPIGLGESPSTPPDAENPDVTRYGLAVGYSVPDGTLPKLRFGHFYKVRARMVDLAGHSVDVKAPGAQLPAVQTLPISYARWEPLVAPAIALSESVKGSPGESMARLVVRSDYNRSVDQYYGDQSSPTYNKDAQRHFLPPKTSQMMAETHGMFDAPPPAGKTWYDVIVKTDVSLPLDEKPPHDPVPLGTDHVTLPYMPDPLAQGVTFLNLPGLPPRTPYTDPEWGGKWPYLGTFKLVLKGIDAAAVPHKPDFTGGDAPVLTVELPKGEMVTVRYGSRFDPAALGLMAVWQWMVEAGLANVLLKPTQQGLIWLLTPYHEITLVHAVQRPLIKPAFSTGFHAARKTGATSALLVDKPTPISGRSTMKVDFTARWYEPVDDVTQPGPDVLDNHAHVSELPIIYGDTHLQYLPDNTSATDDQAKYFTHEIGNTRYHRISYTAVATTRYREYFPFTPAELKAKPDLITRSSDSKMPPKPTPEHAKAASVVDATHLLPHGMIDVPSTARPQSPKLLYVIPMFAHQSGSIQNGIGSIRRGGGLRVYLERPWYSSGEGELLGVVLPPERIRAGHSILALGYKTPDASHITQWGLDPIWFSHNAPAPTAPALNAFVNAARTGNGLTIDEQAGVPVAVAGHEVSYDADRRLWYADIVVGGGLAYYPFIRLALARYQPNSIADAHLSRLVLADFAQIAPDRGVSVVFNTADPRQMQVIVAGPAPYRTTNVVEVSLEQHLYAGPQADADLGWIPVDKGALVLKSSTVKDETVWSGEYTLPVLPKPLPPLRLVVREYEIFAGSGAPANAETFVAVPTAKRLVYAEVLDVLLPG